jgi:uncharacterized protein (TIGR00645 family)
MSGGKQITRKAARNLSLWMIRAARWIMAPIYMGLLLSLLLLAEKSIQQLVTAIPDLLSASTSDTILTVLKLVDLSLVANLVVIVMVSGWENFVGRLFVRKDETQLEWVGNLDFSTVKLKLVASVAAIAAIQLLETFVHIGQTPKQDAMWQLLILLGIGVTGVLLALMDRLGGES